MMFRYQTDTHDLMTKFSKKLLLHLLEHKLCIEGDYHHPTIYELKIWNNEL